MFHVKQLGVMKLIELKMNKNYNYIVTKEMIEEGKKYGLARRNLYDRL